MTGQTLKALTIWQPWASLIALGEKQYETRGWPTKHRGLLAIHAAVRHPEVWQGLKLDGHLWRTLERRHLLTTDLPHSAVVCLVELVDVFRAEEIRHELTEQELSFGDFADGRYAWRLNVVEVFTTPHPARGRQGLWNWTQA